jgi:hypothetical protein
MQRLGGQMQVAQADSEISACMSRSEMEFARGGPETCAAAAGPGPEPEAGRPQGQGRKLPRPKLKQAST